MKDNKGMGFAIAMVMRHKR